MNFQGMACRRFCGRMSLSVGVPLGNLGRGSVYRELWEVVEGGLPKWSISLYGRSVRGTWRCKRRLWRWAPLSMGASLGNLGEGSYAGGLCMEEGSGTGVSPHGGPIQGPREGVGGGSVYRELWEMEEGGSRDGASLKRLRQRASREGSFTGYPGLWKEGSDDGPLSSRGLSWATWSGLIYWGLWEMAERGYGVGAFLWELCEGNLEGGFPYWGPWRICRKGTGEGHLFP